MIARGRWEQQHEVEVETDCNGVRFTRCRTSRYRGQVAYGKRVPSGRARGGECQHDGRVIPGYDLGDEDIREWSFRLPCEACDGSGWDPHDDDSNAPKCEVKAIPLVDPVTFIKQSVGRKSFCR